MQPERSLTIPEGLPNVRNARLPEGYESAKTALSECSRIDECADWANKAEALASYARQAGDDTLRKTADRIQARAIRRCGELLKAISPAKNQHTVTEGAYSGTPTSRSQAARDAGLSKDQKVTALRVASVPDEDFESAVESEYPPTVTQLAEQGTKSQPKPLTDLQGRDPWEFARSTEGQGCVGRLFEFTDRVEPGVVARGAFPNERQKILAQIAVVMTWLKTLQKELEKS